MKAAARSPNTIHYREKLLRRVDHELPMGLERATVEELADWLGGGTVRGNEEEAWSAKTKLTYYETIRALFVWATDPRNPVIDYDPSASLARPHARRGAPHPVTEDEMATILRHTEGFWYVAALLASHEGARACEVAALRREDVTEDNVLFDGKGGLVAAVPTHPLVWRTVRDFPPGSIAKHLLGRAAPANYISFTFPRYVRRTTGLLGMNLHRLRHRFATILLTARDDGGAGADLRTVQELMRHASPTQTAVYTQITDRQRKMAVSALPVLTPTPN